MSLRKPATEVQTKMGIFLRPKAARWLIDSGRWIVPDFRTTAQEAGSNNPDRDAAIVFCGFIHCAIALYLAFGKIKPDDIAAILGATALSIRQYAPHYSLPVSYLDDTNKMVGAAIQAADRDPLKWIPGYYNAVHHLVDVDEIKFSAALSAYVFRALNS